MLVVLDTNVLISALLWHGKLERLLALVGKNQISLCFPQETLEELSQVLNRSKFRSRLLAQDLTVSSILQALINRSKIFKIPNIETDFVKEDPDDDKFILLALASGTKYLVSGDKHLLKLAKFGSVNIVSPTDFLKISIPDT